MGVPAIHVDEGGKGFMGVTLGTKDQQRDKDREEPQNMQHQQSTFKLGEKPPSSYVDEDAEQDDCPVE